MTRFLFAAAFAVGAVAILWIGRIFLGVDALGLGVTSLIGLVYAIGTFELIAFRRATLSLNVALAKTNETFDDLEAWLANIDTSLQNAVRLRVGGERASLPAPVLTPYFVGLLVMLGLLGTFVGMVDTLKGAVVALEGSSELEAIRAGLAAPIEGLGLAFGTSVAGVAASAMLGLLSTISRRERLQASHELDRVSGTHLSRYSASHQQKLAFKAIQDQAQALPEVALQLSDLANNIEQMNERMAAQLLDNQNAFQDKVVSLYGDLATSVDESLKTSLVNSAELINANIQPVAEKTLAQLTESANETHKRLGDVSAEQVGAMETAVKKVTDNLRSGLDSTINQHGKLSQELVEHFKSVAESSAKSLGDTTDKLLAGFGDTREAWAAKQDAQAAAFTDAIKQQLLGLREDESKRGDASVARLAELQSSVADQLAQLGAALEEPMTRLIETASQTPKAAADVIEKLRAEMSKNLERDNELLSERKSLMQQLDSLSSSLEASSSGQRDAIDTLVKRSTETLAKVGAQFGEHVEGESSKLANVADHFAASSAEMASLSDAFNAAVGLFSESNNQLIENLTRIEAALEKSNNRSDEQLAYYVAQAREIIDHNLLSHQQIIGALNMQQPEQIKLQGVAEGAK